MRRLLLLLLVAPAIADPVEDAAEKALAAHKAGDAAALKALAEKDDPDPWRVADELCARGEHDAAEAFARAAPRPDVEMLPGFVASRRGKTVDTEARAALAATNAALAAKDFAGALKAIEDAPPPKDDDVAAVRMAYARGVALRGLLRPESTEASMAAGRRARELGWLARAAHTLHEAGMRAYDRSDFRVALALWQDSLEIADARQDRRGVARTLGNLGLAYYALGDYAKALECHERALKLMEELGDNADAATTVGNIGNVHFSLGNYATALGWHERALKLKEALGDRAGVAMSLGNIGAVHSSRGDYPKALAYQERALKLMEELGDRASVAAALGNIGVVHNSRGDYPKALAYQERALKLKEELGDRAGVAMSLGNVGLVYHRLGDYPKALGYQERALKLVEELGDRAGVANTLAYTGLVHYALGDYAKALGYHERALKLMEELGDRAGAAATLGSIGNVHDSLGDHPKALGYQERSLKLKEELGDRAGVAITLGNIGLVHFFLGGYPTALAYQERSLKLKEELGDRAGVATTLGNIGIVHDSLGDYAKALGCYERSLKLKEELGDRAGAAATLANIGVVHRSLGDYPRALGYQQRALKVMEELGDRAGAAATLGNIGIVQDSLGDYPKALEYHERAFKLMEELGDRAGVATTLGNLGVGHHSLGDYAKALECHERALKLKQVVGDRGGVAITLEAIGHVHHALEDYAKAVAYYEDALNEAERLGLRDTAAHALWGLSLTHLARGDAARAAASSRRAVQVVGQLAKGLGEEEGASGRERFDAVFHVGARAALALCDASEVSFFLESGRAMTLLESLGGRERVQGVLPKELRDAEAGARAAESVALALYRKALETGGDVDPLWKEVEGARGRVIEATRRLQREAKAQADVVYPEAAPVDRIRSILRPGEALVTYALLKDDALALVVTRESARIVQLGKSAAITKAAAALQVAVLRPDERGVATPPHERLDFVAKRLRALLVEPLRLNDTARLLVAPHAELAYVPFALLTDAEVVYVPSGTTYELLLADAALRGEGVLALGDPPAADDQAATVYRGGEEFAPLPASRAEAETIGDIVLVGKDATEGRFLEAVASRPRWRAVHLACHGLVRADQPELSCLALGADETNDGFLTVLEVFRMKVPADLVVLSACETAKGKVYRAEGVIGLARAFMLAGSPRVLCSLWKVDDAATRELMTNFYKEWKPGVGAAAALRRAQAHVASQEKWKDPYFWAAWQLWGLPE